MNIFSSEPKATSNWYAAATHYLTGGLLATTIISGLLGFGLGAVFKVENALFTTAIKYLIEIVASWLAIIYSVHYLNRSHIVTDKARVVTLSTIYYLIVSLIFLYVFYVYDWLYALTSWLQGRGEQHITTSNDLIFIAIDIVIGDFIFYILSKWIYKA